MTWMTTVFLTVFLLAFNPIQSQAYEGMTASPEAECAKDTDLHKALYDKGFFQYLYAMTDYGFMISVFIGPDSRYVMTAEAEGVACILTTGVGIARERDAEI